MDIDAQRVTYHNREAVVLTGRTTFEEPYVKLAIQDSLTTGAEGLWSLLVDVVPYTEATSRAAGRTEEEATADARAAYISALAQHDVDGFEAEMFWDSYVDVEWAKQNPFATQNDNPYLDQAQPSASSEGEGWGPRNMARTSGGADV